MSWLALALAFGLGAMVGSIGGVLLMAMMAAAGRCDQAKENGDGKQ
jgi:hypothetical protein